MQYMTYLVYYKMVMRLFLRFRVAG